MQQIAEWILSKNPELDREITRDEDLIEGRLIDSLDFLEFIYLLESLSGEVIDLQEVSIDDFRTLTRIQERFLAGTAAAAASASGVTAGAGAGAADVPQPAGR
ncbi:acyl carrier protein [Kitasatospora sp. NBC_01539]|uniref:acyl carrier protein n=1 Tax=Kitasatospora sp. NBC_01539 TaxID=2903577 RepID=UPI00386016C2